MIRLTGMSFRSGKLPMVAIIICIAQPIYAQRHYDSWFRGTLSVPAGDKLRIDAEVQHRRQNGFGNTDMFDGNLMFAFRNWIHYRYSENVKFSVSPFAYFSHYKIIQQPMDATRDPSSEIRFSAAIDLQHNFLKKLNMTGRSAIEYRVFENNRPAIARLRTRFGFRYDFTKRLKPGIYDELFCNLSGTTAGHCYDHNRIGLNLEYNVSARLKFDIGYIALSRLPLTSKQKLHEHNTYLNLTYLWKKHGNQGIK